MIIESSVIQLLADQKIRREATRYIEPWMLEGQYYRAIFKVLRKEKYQITKIDYRVLLLELVKEAEFDQDECQSAVRLIKNSKPLTTDLDRASAIEALQEFIQDKLLSKAIESILKNGISSTEKQLIQSAMQFSLQQDPFFDFSNNEHIDRAKTSDFPAHGKLIKSYFDVVNKASVINGYKYGDLIMYAAGPKIGKTTSMVCEGANAIDQGYRVAHMILGDMSDFDTYIKYMGYWSGTSSDLLYKDHDPYYSIDIQEKFKNLRVKAYEADALTIYDAVAELHKLYDEWPFDFCFLDYDGNLKETNDNMYKEGGVTYGQLKGFAKGRCVFGVGSQTNKNFWQIEVVPQEAAAESSKKQHAIDYMITIGRNPDCKYIGTVSLPLIRRGAAGLKVRIHFKLAYARINEITPNLYSKLKERYSDISDNDEGIEIDFGGDEDE